MIAARLTPDITIGCRVPSREEYDDHMRLLRDLEAKGGKVSALHSSLFTEREQRVWTAMAQAGIIRNVAPTISGPNTPFAWCVEVLTDYGRIYLAQRGS